MEMSSAEGRSNFAAEQAIIEICSAIEPGYRD